MQDHERDAILAKSREVGYDALTQVEKAAVAAAVSVADPGELHWPARAHCLESLEGHLIKASRLARVMWNAMENGDLALDERDRLGLYELASSVADHASGACYAFYLESGRKAAAVLEKIEADPVFPALNEWERLRDADGSEAAAAFKADILLKTRPTSSAGALALLRFIAGVLSETGGAAILAAADVLEQEARK
jgi:hypothetical protein